MIEYIKGQVAQCTPTSAVIEAAGIGYAMQISLASFTAIQNASGEVKMYVHEVIRDDAHILLGFHDPEERELFRLLVGVSGVGPATALLILSAFSVDETKLVITSGDHLRLKDVKGIGAKTAQRIIVDLKDKIKPADDTLIMQPNVIGGPAAERFDEALSALVALGFPRPASQKVLRRIFDSDPSATIETAIKQALKMLR